MNATQEAGIIRHGQQLLAIFPNAREQDPVKLCKKLRTLEARAAAIALRLCNGPEYPEGEADRLLEDILAKVNALLGNTSPYAIPVFINRDPRGCALKVQDDWIRDFAQNGPTPLPTDMGGYGLIAPEIK